MSGPRFPTIAPRLDGYDYVSLLGTGGYADVFLYLQHRPRRHVAVKVLLAAGTESRRQQFADEADAMARVSAHPYIVTIFSAAVSDDGRPYLVMEYYPRPHLGVRAQSERLAIAEVMRTGIQLAGAVESAHRIGILHRDIKPANVLTSEYGRPGLTDFGIWASAGGVPQAGSEDRGGMSIPWSAPEVFKPQLDPDERSDVYALGATVWHLLAGRSPFHVVGGDNSPLPMMRRIESDQLKPTGRDDVPAELGLVLERAMRKNPSQRYSSAFEFARALQAVQQQLRLGVTQIEVPEAHRSPVGGGDAGDDATRFKPRRVEAQHVGGVARPAPALPAPHPESALAGDGSAAAEPARPHRYVIAGSIAALAVAAGIGFLATRDRTREPAVVPSSNAPVPQEVVAGTFVAAVEGSAARVSPLLVRYSWAAAEPREGDFFLISRADAGPGPRPTGIRQSAAVYELPGNVGPVPCLSIVLVRQTGQPSEPAIICASG